MELLTPKLSRRLGGERSRALFEEGLAAEWSLRTDLPNLREASKVHRGGQLPTGNLQGNELHLRQRV